MINALIAMCIGNSYAESGLKRLAIESDMKHTPSGSWLINSIKNIPDCKNCKPNVVFPLPGDPDTVTERPGFNPPDMTESSPGIPVFTLEYVESMSIE